MYDIFYSILGDLILSLDKDDSQLLGLDGKKQKDRNYRERESELVLVKCIFVLAVTVINLMSESFKPGKPKYNKAKECLKRLSSPVNLVICLNTTSSNQGTLLSSGSCIATHLSHRGESPVFIIYQGNKMLLREYHHHTMFY